MGSRHRKKHQPAQQQNKVPHKFSVDERVLCYEPDQKKARVLYDSKVLQAVERTDDKGKIRVEYKIHFFGWNSSWDRYVDEDCVLKDTDENRQLQKELKEKADVLIQSNTKNKKKRKKTITEILKEATKSKSGKSALGSKAEGDSGKSSSESDVSDQDSSDDEGKREQVQINLTDRMKAILEHDYYNICTRQMLVRLPAQVSVVCVFEGYVKFLGFRELKRVLCENNMGTNQLPSSGSAVATTKGASAASCFSKTQVKPVGDNMGEKLARLYRKVKQAQETVYGLKTLFDFTLFQLLLYESEDEQFAKIKDFQAVIPVINCSALVPKLAIPVPVPVIPIAGPSVSRDRELMPPPPPPKVVGVVGKVKDKDNKLLTPKSNEKGKPEKKERRSEEIKSVPVDETTKTLRRKSLPAIKSENDEGKDKSKTDGLQPKALEVNKTERRNVTRKSVRGKKQSTITSEAKKDVAVKTVENSPTSADIDDAKALECKTIQEKFLKTVEDMNIKKTKPPSVSANEQQVQNLTLEQDKARPKRSNSEEKVKKDDPKTCEEKEISSKNKSKRVSTNEKIITYVDLEPKPCSSKQLVAEEKAKNKLAKALEAVKSAASNSGGDKNNILSAVDKTVKVAEKQTEDSAKPRGTNTAAKSHTSKEKTVQSLSKPVRVDGKVQNVDKTAPKKGPVVEKRVTPEEEAIRKAAAAREAEERKLKLAMRNVPKLEIIPRRRIIKSANAKSAVPPIQVPRVWLGRINAYMKELQSWRMLPIDCYSKNHEPDPSMIYGLIHLLRFFMKLPEILNSMRIPRRKIRIVAHHVNQMIEHIHGCYNFTTIALYLPPPKGLVVEYVGRGASAGGKVLVRHSHAVTEVRSGKRQCVSQKQPEPTPRVCLALPKVIDAPAVNTAAEQSNCESGKVNLESQSKPPPLAGPSVKRKGRKDKAVVASKDKDALLQAGNKAFDQVEIKKERLSPPPPEETPICEEPPKKSETKTRKVSPPAPMVRQVRKSAADAAFKNAHIFVSQQILTPRSSSASRKQDGKGKSAPRKRRLSRDESESVKKSRVASSAEGIKSEPKPTEDTKKSQQKQIAPSPNASKTPQKLDKPSPVPLQKQRRSSSFLEETTKESTPTRSRNLSGPERTNRSLVKDLGRRNSSPRAASPPKKLPSPRGVSKSNSFNKESAGPSKSPQKSVSPTTSIRLRSRSDERQLRSKGSLINALSLPMNAIASRPSCVGRSKEEKTPKRRASSGNKVSDVSSEGSLVIKKERDSSPIRSLRRNRK